MDSFKQRRWLIASVLLAFAAFAFVVLRPQQGPVGATNANVGGGGSALVNPALDLSSVSGPNEWAMEGYGPARNRVLEGAMVLPMTRQRAVRVAGAADGGSPPSIARDLMLIESKDHLQAIDLRSGVRRWQAAQPGSYISPAIAGERVFIRAEAGNQGQVLALNLRDGKQLWAFTPKRLSSPETNYFGGHLTSPVVVEGMLFVGAGKEVYALDASTGQVRWEYATQDYITSSATVDSGRVYISDFKQVYALDQASGKLLWTYGTTSSVSFSAVAAGDTVLVTNGDNLAALDATSGAQRWIAHYPGEGLIPGAVLDGRVFVKSTATLYALDLASGKELWRYSDINFVSLPAVAGNQVFIVSGNGVDTAVDARDAASGRSIWHQPIAALMTTAPVIAGQTIYVRTTDGRVLSFWP